MLRTKTLGTLFCILAAGFCGLASTKDTKPKLRVAADGFPKGQDTPEGSASDLARAFINSDVELFSRTCIGLYASNGPAEYDAFMRATIESMKQEPARKDLFPQGPTSIAKVFAARHLSRNGPASYGYATFGFFDVMFVDIKVHLRNGKTALNRTMVIREKDGKWYAHPAPNVSPLLSYGPNEESASVVDFSEVYDVEK